MNEKRNDRQQQGGGMDKDRQGQQERKDQQRTPQKSGPDGGLGGREKEGQERQREPGAMDRQKKAGRDIEEDVE